MISPPIVGVPALAWCSCGPVLADVLAELLDPQVFDEFGAEEDADQHRRHARDQDLAHQRRSSSQLRQRLGDRLEAGRARALDQDGVARLELGGRAARPPRPGRRPARRGRSRGPARRRRSPGRRRRRGRARRPRGGSRRRRGRARPSRRGRRPCAARLEGARGGRAPRASRPGWRCSSRSRGRFRRRARGARRGSGRSLCPQRGRPSPPSGAPSATPAAIAASALVRLCASAKGKWKRCSPAGVATSASVTPSATRASTRLDVAAGAEAQQPRRPLAGAAPARPPRPGRPRCRPAGSAVEHLGLGRGDRLDRAEQLDVDRADVGDHRRRRARRSPPARRSGRRPRIAISSTSVSVSSGASSTVSGSPISVLRFSRLAWTAAGQQRPGDVLDRGLADRAGDPDHPRAERAAGARGQRLQRRQRIGDGEDPRLPPLRQSCARDPDRCSRAHCGPTTTPQAPGLDRRRGELAAVAVRAAQAEEEVAGAGSRRSRSSPARGGPAAPSASDLGAERGGDLPPASSVHAGLPSLPQLLAGDLAVVEGDLAAVLELLALLVALAGDHDRVAGLGPAQRQRDRGAAVDLDLDLGAAARPRRRLRRRSPPGPRSAGCRR